MNEADTRAELIEGWTKMTMRDGWEICLERPRGKERVRPRVYVSLNRRGEIAMNEAAFSLIGRPASVTLMYDRANRSIGVKFPVAADRHFFPARRYGRGRKMRIVRAARALKQFGIEVERTIVFCDARVEMFRKEPMLVLELDRAEDVSAPTAQVKSPPATAGGTDRQELFR
jgi:hypothetical protein